MRRYLLIVLILISPALSWASYLKRADILPTMQEIFEYHVEFKELTPLLIKRSFKICMEQFDLEKVYLLREEALPFLQLTDQQAQEMVKRCKAGDFSDYEQLIHLFQQSIKRIRSFREEVERELILSSEPINPVAFESYLEFAKDEGQLKTRLKKQLVRLLFAEKQASKFSALNPQNKEKIFSLWNKRFERVEKPYLLFDQKGRLLESAGVEHFLVVHILKVLAKSLDAHTAFFSPEEALEMRISLEKQFEGVGVVLREGIDGIIIEDIIKGGPADRCGKIARGDLLVEIDGTPLQGVSYEEVLKRMKGSGQTKVHLGFKRQEESLERTFQVQLMREKILMQEERLHFTAEPFGDGVIGKIVLPAFYESGGDSSCELDLREAIKDLKKQGKLLGLILDLRENSGGFLNQAVKVAGLFITSGVIVISKYAEGEIRYLRDIDGRLYFNGPFVILTSKASASAAEIVAQALQDYGTALIVGDERTYGKGSIQYQTVTDEGAKAFFKVTVGKYYTVSGRSTQIEGVKADIIVPTEYSIYNIGERFLEYPLPSDQITAAYIDPLTDIDQKNLHWFQKNYLPNLQKKGLFWGSLLPLLKENSHYRLGRDKNFQLFLNSLQEESKKTSPKNNWGKEDLQMAEGVKILKDMIFLHQQKEAPLLAR